MDYNPTVDLAQITNSRIVIYRYNTKCGVRSVKQQENEKNLTRGVYNGYMSPKTKSKVSNRLTTWIESSLMVRKSYYNHNFLKKPLITFVTLTLSAKQQHSDNEIKRQLLIPFIQLMISKYNVVHYFWRAESQKNGNIHFHIIVDSYINHSTLRHDWNLAQEKLGYITTFENKFNHRNPNSTDIHSLKHVNNPAAYICKYVCKEDGYRSIEGRIHGCSDSLRLLKPFEITANNNVEEYVKRTKELNLSEVFYGDNFTIIRVNNKKHLKALAPEIYKEKLSYMNACAKYLYTTDSNEFYDYIYPK